MRVGRPHGLDGSFYVEDASAAIAPGDEIEVAGRMRLVVRRAGTDARPIVRLDGIEDRDAAAALRGQPLRTDADDAPGEDEWRVDELVGCRIDGLGEVEGVLAGPSCDVLQVGGRLVPLVRDAVKRVDVEARVIEVDRRFLGL